MDKLKTLLQIPLLVLRMVGLALAALFSAIFGDVRWEAPEWLTRLGDGFRALGALIRRKPRQSAVVAGILLVLAGSGYLAWHWWKNLPRPVEVDFTVAAPERTCYECETDRAPKPLLVKFEASVARLEDAGKNIDPAKAGITVSPRIAGTWHWDDDRTLRFQPKEDWPIGAKFEVGFARKGFVADQIRLAEYSLEFSTAAFEAAIDANDFYQDPVNATDKKFVTTLRFTHPVDSASLEERIKLALYNKISDWHEEKLEAPKFTVTYDKYKLHAYVHSEALDVPAKEGRAEIVVGKGLHAIRKSNETTEELTASVTVPGLYSLAVQDIDLHIVRDERDEPDQVLMLETSYSALEKDVVPRVHAWLLPVRNPDVKRQAAWERNNHDRPYPWSGPQDVTPDLLKASETMVLGYVPNERDHVELHSFRFSADPGRYVYVTVDKGLRSFGGYLLADPVDRVLRVPDYPKELRIAQQGALLALSGKHQLSVFTRDVPGMRVDVGRLLPNQLQHLVTQSHGDISNPQFSDWSFNESNLTEHYSQTITLPTLRPGEAHYEALDFDKYINHPGASRQGIFFLRVRTWDPKTSRSSGDGAVVDGSTDDSSRNDYRASTEDVRLVVVTDLGMLVKRSATGEQDLFVQSIHGGDPVAGVTVDVIGKNGEPVQTQMTDAEGHAHFASLSSYKNERQPVLYLARKGGDSSFLPVEGGSRMLDMSRFDVGGVNAVADPSKLTAYLFSDRGIYRPGDEIRGAAIIKAQDWRKLPAGLPLKVEVIDPRGVVVKREQIRLSAAGFEEFRYQTRDTAPTGGYAVNIYIVKEDYRQDLIGSINVNVQEFQPDRLKMSAHFSSEQVDGWVAPEDLKARVNLQNLFGTPAATRRVVASMTLSPSFPRFSRFPDFEFRDPQTAKEGFTDRLVDQKTDDKGEAAFDLNLQRFARATYRLSIVAQGYEADGGRGVNAEAAQLVSSLPYLVGWKADGDLDYVSRGADRRIQLIAINPKATKTAVTGLVLRRIERKYVSVLIKQDNGTYKYESRLKEVPLDEKSFAIAATGTSLAVDSTTPGSFSYVVADAAAQVFARIDYTVAGQANLTRSLEKNAELQIVLNRQDYAPGDEIEMQINAPYTGAGLITIERDKVYSWRWFRTTTTSSVQKIRVPDAVEGNAYVSVSFVRDPASEEIYTSPLSYGVKPFSIALDRRRTAVTLDAPTLVKPGDKLVLKYHTSKPARIAIFAVDEGILQVAQYQTPDPLAHFFQKRALDVRTRQILDLILPEFRAAMLSAPGGDGEAAIGRHLNPFKRKTDKPVAWWSGIVDADTTTRELSYVVPDYFNGTLRLMAVAVSDESLGVAEGKTTVRGDFVLSPNAPLTVTPGDEFDVSVGVANNVVGSGPDAAVTVTLAPSSHFEVVGPKAQTVKIGELRESSVRFHVKVRDELGSASLKFSAAANGKTGSIGATVSVRPATPFMTQLIAGTYKGSTDVDVRRDMYPQYRTLDASVSSMPLGLAHGLTAYLGNYPYSCTEQLVSMAVPGIVLSSRPEFGYVKAAQGATLEGLVDELRLRQNGDGAYRYWAGGVQVEEYASLYAQHVLLEADARGIAVPHDLITSGNNYLRTIAGRDGNNLEDERNSAYAIYLLARQGNMVANEAAALQRRLEERYTKEWRQDVVAAWLAGAYQLMKQQQLAEFAIAKVQNGVSATQDRWYGPMVSDAVVVYITARHFPARLPNLPEAFLDRMVTRIRNGEYQSLAAATTVLALDAYASASGPATAGKLKISEVLANKNVHALALPDGLFPRTAYTPQAVALRFENASPLRAYYLVNQSGFDRRPPTEAIRRNFEIIREYTDVDGKPVTQVKMGDEVVVHVKYRAIDRESISDAVLVDLLPGGFEPVLPRLAKSSVGYEAASTSSGGDESGEGNYEGDAGYESDDGAEPDCSCGILWSWAPGGVDYADTREDRVVAYARATGSLQEFTYRIKATNVGSFVVPPAYGESMYEPQVRARSVAGRIQVVRP